tara:strand:+ start:1600 stop:2682 length:1083 start_codon:yes stop_codon:yes gene_type:complete
MEINLIIPAAGKSSRFNAGKPKWLRTHPDGKLMIEHAVDAFDSKNIKINTFIITTSDLNNEHNISDILNHTSIENFKLILLDKKTKSAVETIYSGIKSIGKNFNYDNFTILKDSDNYVKSELENKHFKSNFTIGCDLNEINTSRVSNKSFLIINEFNLVTDFIEKKIVSDKISVGTHGFTDFSLYMNEAKKLSEKIEDKELFNSHIIASLIYKGKKFNFIKAKFYIDFGTQKEWNNIFRNHSTYFVDFDGTLVKNKGKYGSNNWSNLNDDPLTENINVLKSFTEKGATIIITTSRSAKYSNYIKDFLKNNGLNVNHVLCDLNHSPRVIINDFANTNPFPSCSAISFPRNSSLASYFQYDF